MLRAALVALLMLAPRPGAAQPAADALVDWDASEALRVRLRASVVPLLLVPADAGPLLLPGHQGTAVALRTPDGPRLLTATRLLVGGTRPKVVLSEERQIGARVVRTDGAIALLALDPWPPELAPVPLAAPEAERARGDLVILSNVWSFGHEVLTRGALAELVDDPVLGPIWVTNVVSPDGTPLLTAEGEVAAVPFAPYGPETTLAAGVGRISALLAPRGRPAEGDAPLPRRR